MNNLTLDCYVLLSIQNKTMPKVYIVSNEQSCRVWLTLRTLLVRYLAAA